ncbi:hypothetical protein [Lentzea sp. NPDC004782]|uniref:hypothetical protein n=1 Tax=Lentzea sp. NPDC004782 TaxID=3154458 RepID=UPI0033BECA66
MNSRQKAISIASAVIFGLGTVVPTIEGSPVPALVGVPIAVAALAVFIATVVSARSGKSGESSK